MGIPGAPPITSGNTPERGTLQVEPASGNTSRVDTGASALWPLGAAAALARYECTMRRAAGRAHPQVRSQVRGYLHWLATTGPADHRDGDPLQELAQGPRRRQRPCCRTRPTLWGSNIGFWA